MLLYRYMYVLECKGDVHVYMYMYSSRNYDNKVKKYGFVNQQFL